MPRCAMDRYPWSLARFWDVFGYARITVTSATQLTWEFVNTMNGTVIDSLAITSGHDFGAGKA